MSAVLDTLARSLRCAGQLVMAAGAILLLGVVLIAGMVAASSAAAHQAPSGWHYDDACCNTRDCGPAAAGQITEERREGVLGYAVRIPPGGHHYFRGAVDAFVPAGDPRVRVSGDSDRHACVNSVGAVLCLYIPPGGV